MGVKLNTASGGSVSIEPTNTASNFTLTVPAQTGTTVIQNASNNLLMNSGYGSDAVAYGCRAWVNFNGTGTVAIRASGNVSSITDVQTGVYNVNLTTAMPDSNYAAVVTGSEGGGSGDKLWAYSISTSAVRVVVYTGTGSLVDNPNCQVAVFR